MAFIGGSPKHIMHIQSFKPTCKRRGIPKLTMPKKYLQWGLHCYFHQNKQILEPTSLVVQVEISNSEILNPKDYSKHCPWLMYCIVHSISSLISEQTLIVPKTMALYELGIAITNCSFGRLKFLSNLLPFVSITFFYVPGLFFVSDNRYNFTTIKSHKYPSGAGIRTPVLQSNHFLDLHEIA